MAGLLNPTGITALEASQVKVSDEADTWRDKLNALKIADPENLKHATFGALAQAHENLKLAIARVTYAIESNEDAYGK